MANDNIAATSTINDSQDYQTPLITVSGELSNFILDGHLASQINSDLARESIDWQRSSHDVSPIPVYVEASFVRLNEHQHLLWDLPSKKSDCLTEKTKSAIKNNDNICDKTTVSNNISNNNDILTSGLNRIRQTNVSTLKRHHSFQNMVSTSASLISGQNVRSLLGSHVNNDDSMQQQQSQQQQQQQLLASINYHHLFNLLSRRYILNNGSRVLLNSYWLNSNHDLESYNSQIRDSLLDWFQKILQITANQYRLGLNQDFNLDFFIVIVVRNSINSNNINMNQSNMNDYSQQQEQLLNLKNLVNDKNVTLPPTSSSSALNLAKNMKNNKNDKKQKPQPNQSSLHSLSSSMTSLNTNINSSNNLTCQQLADQIRNDLLVCFQLFRQNNTSTGTINNGIPANNSRVAHQLIERIIIFDSTSNSNSMNVQKASSSNHSNSLTIGHNFSANNPSSNPIISSTARTFSALSNFSTNSMKIAPTTTISKSPTRSASRLSKMTGNSSTPFSASSATIGSMLSATAIFNYCQFIIKIRQFLLEFYTRQFDCFEKLIRHIRELRNDPDWDFFGFFLLQEELAFAYESLGLYSKALIQYDELDALFSQLIQNVSLNGGFGAPKWLRYRLMQNIVNDPLIHENGNAKQETWTGLCLCNQESIMKLRMSIVHSVLADFTENHDKSAHSDTIIDPLGGRIKQQISLLDFRNYLYARQCHLLCLLNKPWELASRALPFLQTSVAELNMLEISITPGGIACWVFLSVLEILRKCERYSDSSQLESYSFHTVGLWSYARDKLIELGKICNLMPDYSRIESNDIKKSSSYTSEHLHRMVELVAGMGTDPHIRPSNSIQNESNWMSPQERLKDALSSQESFLRQYLEITELTMGTFKHIDHIRCARAIGKQLAELYLKLNKPQQALPFLLDLYHLFQMESWPILRFEACRLLAQCLEQLYFNIANTLVQPSVVVNHQNHSNSNNFNLEPIIRSAFRAYLLLLLKTDDKYINDSLDNDIDGYFRSMSCLLKHYEKRGIKLIDILLKNNESNDNDWLNQKLMIIHNSHSDLFNEASKTSTTTGASSSSSSSTTATSSSSVSAASSNSNFNNSTNDLQSKTNSNEHLVTHHHQQQQQQNYNGNMIHNTNMIHNRSYSQQLSSSSLSSLINYSQPNFFQIKSYEIDCDSLLNNNNNNNDNNNHDTSLKKNNQSFIAGSCLKLRLRIFSYLNVTIKLDRIIVTLQCHRNEPWSSSANTGQQQQHNSNKINNEKYSHESMNKIPKCSCMSSITTNDSQYNYYQHYHQHQQQQQQHQYDLLWDNEQHSNENHFCCDNISNAYVEKYYCQTLRLAGIKCLDSERLLRRSDFFHNYRSFDCYRKFISQSLPLSLLNQRLSYDDYNKYFRFLSSKFKFQNFQDSENSDNELVLKTGLNEFELKFQSPNELHKIVKQLNSFNNNNNDDQNNKSNQLHNTNHVWFNLDQLILFCDKKHQFKNSDRIESMKFALIEDFNCSSSSSSNRSVMNNGIGNFRLVECPPSIELVPLFDETEDVNLQSMTNENYKRMSNMFFIGIEQSVCLRLNSGTTILPKGLKCFFKIKQLSTKNSSINDIDHHLQSFDYDQRLINVSLFKINENDVDNEESEYFILDHQLEPFETYQLNLRLRSSYRRTKLIQLFGNNNNNWTNLIDTKSMSIETKSKKFIANKNNRNIEQYDFKLSLLWSNNNDDDNIVEQNQSKQMSCSCHFTLYDSFIIHPNINTASPFCKLLSLKLNSSKRLPSDIELYFQYPKLKIVTSDSNDDEAKYENLFKFLNFNDDNNNDDFKQKLTNSNELNFIWSLNINDAEEQKMIKNVNKIYFEFQFKPKQLDGMTNIVVKMPYTLSIHYSFQTKYTIRQWIEPLIVSKSQSQQQQSLSSDIIRIGNSCSLRVKIERIFNNEEMDENDEYIMYELICDPQLWQFVASSNSIYQSLNNNIDVNDNNDQSNGSSSLNSNCQLPTTMSSSVSNSSDTSRVIKFNKNSQTFEIAFEIIPLMTGYIPLPLIRLSQYFILLNDNQTNYMKTSSSNTHSHSLTNEEIVASTNQIQNKTTNAIESLSAMLSENLSLSSKNWSKYLTSSSLSSSSNQANNIIDDHMQQQKSLNSLQSINNTAKLEPFEPGQIYNYNRSSQIYVLPSLISQNLDNNNN